jgi:hypothetical protein
MAGLFQGDPLPALTTTTEQQQTAPEFYTNYLQDIANLGQNAVTQGGVAGFSPLQQQALSMAPNLAFAGQGSLGAASQLLGQAGATTAPDVVADYMNPYTNAVVGEMGRLQQRNIRENVLPNLAGAAVGTGQFGSRRQAQVTGQTLRDLQSDLIGKQLGALQQGYTQSTQAAQTDLSRALQAGQAFENLGQQQQALGTTGLKTLYDYGAQEQALGQKMLDLPMAQAQAFAKLMQGYQIPTGTTQQVTGSQGYSNSPLSQIAGLLTGLGSFLRTPTQTTSTTTDGTTVTKAGKNGGVMRKANGGNVRRPPMSLTHRGQGKKFRLGGYADGGAIAYTDGNGNVYDLDGNLVG